MTEIDSKRPFLALRTRTRLLCLCCLALFLAYKSGFVLLTNASRQQPVEIDDAYTYIWKAMSFYDCGFVQDCVLSAAMKPQVFMPNHPEPALQSRIFNRLYLGYSYLHNTALAALHHFGLSWPAAFQVLAVIGGGLLAASILVLGVHAVGWVAASMALIFLTPLNFHDHGLHVIVPSNWSLAFFFLSMCCLLAKTSRFTLAYVLAVLSAFTHPVGKLYFCIFSLYSIYNARQSKSYRRWLVLGVSGALLFSFPALVEWGFEGELYPTKKQLLVMYPDSLEMVPKYLSVARSNFSAVWSLHGSKTLLFFFVISPVLLLCSAKFLHLNFSRQLLFFGALLLALCGVSIFYEVSARHPGSLFNRVFVPYYILICFLLSSLVLQLITLIRGRLARDVLRFCFALLVFANLYLETPNYLRHLHVRIDRHPWHLSEAQIRDLSASAERDSYVLYQDEIPLFYSAVHGLHSLHGGLHGLPAVPDDPDYIITWNETLKNVVRDQEFRSGFIELDDQALLTISNIDQSNPLTILSRDSNGKVVRLGKSCGDLISTPAADSFVPSLTGSTLCLSGDPSNNSPIKISGIKNTSSALLWPWNGDMSVSYQPAVDATPVSLPFEFPSLVLDDSGKLKSDYLLVDDRGSFLVFRRNQDDL